MGRRHLGVPRGKLLFLEPGSMTSLAAGAIGLSPTLGDGGKRERPPAYQYLQTAYGDGLPLGICRLGHRGQRLKRSAVAGKGGPIQNKTLWITNLLAARKDGLQQRCGTWLGLIGGHRRGKTMEVVAT